MGARWHLKSGHSILSHLGFLLVLSIPVKTSPILLHQEPLTCEFADVATASCSFSSSAGGSGCFRLNSLRQKAPVPCPPFHSWGLSQDPPQHHTWMMSVISLVTGGWGRAGGCRGRAWGGTVSPHLMSFIGSVTLSFLRCNNQICPRLGDITGVRFL